MIKTIVYGPMQCERQAENRYLLAPDVVLVLLQDGTGRLLDLAGKFYALSQTAAGMLYESLRGDPQATAQTIAAVYHVELPQVQQDLSAFLHELERRQLIYGPKKTRRVCQPKMSLFSLILLPLLHGIRTWPASLQMKSWALETLAYLSLRFLGWPTTVRLWQRSSEKLLTSPIGPEWEQAAREIDGVIRAVAARHPFPIECKERALCCWMLARWGGPPVKLLVGIDVFPLKSHCWCELDHLVLSDEQDKCERFTPVLTYQ